MANEYAGSALYAEWVHSGGTMVLNTDFRNFNYAPSIDFIDATAGADTARQRINSFKDGSLRVTILGKTNDGTAVYTPLAEGTGGSVVWGPAGTASGSIKHTLPAISMGVTENVVYNDVVTYDVTFQQNGARVDANY